MVLGIETILVKVKLTRTMTSDSGLKALHSRSADKRITQYLCPCKFQLNLEETLEE